MPDDKNQNTTHPDNKTEATKVHINERKHVDFSVPAENPTEKPDPSPSPDPVDLHKVADTGDLHKEDNGKD